MNNQVKKSAFTTTRLRIIKYALKVEITIQEILTALFINDQKIGDIDENIGQILAGGYHAFSICITGSVNIIVIFTVIKILLQLPIRRF